MNALAITSITNFILAGQVLFLAGMLVRMPKILLSAAWFWAGAMTLLGIAALIGGIDHGFFEQSGIPRYFIQRCNWIVLGAMTFFVLMTTARQFFSPAVQRFFLILGIAQFVVNTVVVLSIDSFLDVILNYAPALVLLLAMNFIGLTDGSGSWNMIAGIVLVFTASAIQAIGIDVFTPLDRNGLYHLLSMVSAIFLYRGGTQFRGTV